MLLRSRSVAWLLLLASAAAVLVTGILTTTTIVGRLGSSLADVDARFWLYLLVAAGLTLASLGLRALRWIFLLRRSGVRIPIRDAYIGYLSGFSLLLAPLLLGEIVVRAYVLRVRSNVAPIRTVQVNLWERACDVIALVLLVAAPSATAMAITLATLVAGGFWRATRTWAIAVVASVAAWVLPGIALWLIVNGVFAAWPLAEAETAYAWSSLLGGLTLAPGGIVITGRELIDHLRQAGVGASDAVTVAIGIRAATVGVSTVLGVVMLIAHVVHGETAAHFDAIAHAYDAQIAVARRDALLDIKTSLMRDALQSRGGGTRGLDVGCGQGWYVARMRTLGFDVDGIDTSTAQLAMAARHVGSPAFVRVGSALDIPAEDGAYDFVYTINVLHHLPSIDDQRRAFIEIARVLRPSGVLFVHEINTRNPLFRFYMGYVFPTLNCIDEGVERWLLPHRLGSYTSLPVREIRYFTFLPDFLPQALVRALAPLERWLERSAFAPYSAHYMAVLQKPA